MINTEEYIYTYGNTSVYTPSKSKEEISFFLLEENSHIVCNYCKKFFRKGDRIVRERTILTHFTCFMKIKQEALKRASVLQKQKQKELEILLSKAKLNLFPKISVAELVKKSV